MVRFGFKAVFQASLALIAVTGLAIAWGLYPTENHYSILSCTISYLGSPDIDRNPQGWRAYQFGMTTLIVLMVTFLLERHRLFKGAQSVLGQIASVPLAIGLILLLAATWIPDSRTVQFLGEKATRVHTRLAIFAIPVMGLGLGLDTLARFLVGVRFATLWPAFLFGGLVTFGGWKLNEWESSCRANPALRHWPGDGIHSTPLWEWFTFIYLTGYIVWMARDWRTSHRVTPEGQRRRDHSAGRSLNVSGNE